MQQMMCCNHWYLATIVSLSCVVFISIFNSNINVLITTTTRLDIDKRKRVLRLVKGAPSIFNERKNIDSKVCYKRDTVIENFSSSSSTTRFNDNHRISYGPICGRQVPLSFQNEYDYPQTTTKTPSPQKIMVLIGYDRYDAGHNNRLLAILRAIEYADDNSYDLGLIRDGWAHSLLRKLFSQTNMPHVLYPEAWESAMELNLGFSIVSQEDILCLEEVEGYKIEPQKGRMMFHYRHIPKDIAATATEYKKKRRAMMRFLWTHPGRNPKRLKRDMCSVIDNFHIGSNPIEYSVVHLRWLDGECRWRLKHMSQTLQKMAEESVGRVIRPGILDDDVSCVVPPSYVKDILTKRDSLDKPLFIITDGQNPEMLERLLQDDALRRISHVVPSDVSWVGGDMMLAVLSNTFIGNPLSSMSRVIAEARLALGFEAWSNFLYARERGEKESGWEFLFEDDFGNCRRSLWGSCRTHEKIAAMYSSDMTI